MVSVRYPESGACPRLGSACADARATTTNPALRRGVDVRGVAQVMPSLAGQATERGPFRGHTLAVGSTAVQAPPAPVSRYHRVVDALDLPRVSSLGAARTPRSLVLRSCHVSQVRGIATEAVRAGGTQSEAREIGVVALVVDMPWGPLAVRQVPRNAVSAAVSTIEPEPRVPRLLGPAPPGPARTVSTCLVDLVPEPIHRYHPTRDIAQRSAS
jgi:hypothetical protein